MAVPAHTSPCSVKAWRGVDGVKLTCDDRLQVFIDLPMLSQNPPLISCQGFAICCSLAPEPHHTTRGIRHTVFLHHQTRRVSRNKPKCGSRPPLREG
jgi:hypothetical protein